MICFKDMTFCSAKCITIECPRRLTPEIEKAAADWCESWSDVALVSTSDMSEGCNDFKPELPL